MHVESENLYMHDTDSEHTHQIHVSSWAKRVALGTAQFGLPYGVANVLGQVKYEDAEAMLIMARNAGIDTLDTAIAYGEAESLLGRIGVSDFHLISKVPAIREPIDSVEDWVERQVESSLSRLKVDSLKGLMLHAPADLLGPYGHKIALGLQRVKDSGLVELIGLSVYSPEQLAAAMEFLPIEIVQIPLNIFDRRFVDSGWLNRLSQQGIEIHARSAFLQGLLLMPSENIPSKFEPFRSTLDSWHAWLDKQELGTSPVQACLAHVASYSEISRLVVGVDTPDQLQEIIIAASLSSCQAPARLASSASTLINPSKWSSL
jgi:aryl-alcohol dehydrogenase-like predicted oxidoreductase